MTYNELVGKIAQRAKELTSMKMNQLRMEHHDAAETEVSTQNNANVILKGKTQGELVEDILVDEFSAEFDFEIEKEI